MNPETVIKPRDGIIKATFHLGLIGQSHYVSLKRQYDEDEYVLANPTKITEFAETEIKRQISSICSGKDESKNRLIGDLNVSGNINEQEKQSKLEHDYEVEFEQESQAFEESCKLRGLPFDTCLQVDTIDRYNR